MRSLGLDIGATNLKLVVLEGENVVERRDEPTRSEDGDPASVLRRVAAFGKSVGPVDSIGVALPGLFDEAGVAELLPNLYGNWTGVPVLEPLEQLLEGPVRLINDGHAFALAEATLGAGRDTSDAMCIVCGTGIGGGLILGGRLHLGVTGRAGEFGHHTVDENGPECPCGNRGCLELYAGARAIAAAASAPTFEDVVTRARYGDENARRALGRAGELIGLAIANVLIFLAAERVVLGGGVTEAGDLILAPLRTAIADRARVAPLDRIEVVPAELGPRAGAIGAALFGAQT